MIRLYSLATYDRTAKPRWLLTEMGVPFEEKRLDRKAKEHEKPEFLRLNPMGRVPVLQHGDTVIFESGAICAYLADLFPEKALSPRPDSPARGEYQQWMYFAAATLDSIRARIMVVEDIPAGELRTTKETAVLEDLRDALGALNRPLAQGSHLVANRFTTADIAVSYALYWCSLWPELDAVIREFPSVAAYIERMKAMPSAIKAEAFSYSG